MVNVCHKVLFVIFLAVALLMPQAGVCRSTFTGYVIKVIDGDSMLVKNGNKTWEVRLWGVDCPEYTQPFATHAKSMSRKLVENKRVTVEVRYRDRL